MLHVSALSKHSDASKQEHGGCPGVSVIFMHCLPSSHGAYDALTLKLHSHVGGFVVLLQVSALSRQFVAFTQEHGGCPRSSVVFKQNCKGPQGSIVGALKLHSHIVVVALQVSAFSKQFVAFKQEQAGCPG